MNRLLACAVLLAGCQYDYDKLYEHQPDDAGMMLSSDKLIAKWFGNMPLTQDCVTCAEQQCEAENAACLGDPQCVAYTECVGKTPNPAGQAACRDKFASWVNTVPFVRERDLNGPYGQCVFRYSCAAQCTNDSELWCTGEYTQPTTSNASVPLKLYLLDAINQTSPVANAMVRVCNAQNARECSETGAMSSGTTNADGMVSLQLPSSFSRSFTGYLEVTGAELYPTLLKLSVNLALPTTQVVSVLRDDQFKFALSSAELTTDDTRGMLQLRMLGCQGAGVKGVHYSLKEQVAGTQTWYIVNGLPKLDARETTPVGSGGIIDIPEGTVTVEARDGEQKLVGTVDAPIRAKFMTVVVYAPLGGT